MSSYLRARMLYIFLFATCMRGICRDENNFVGDWGENCDYWKGKSCSLLPEARGASQLGRDILRCKCPSNCRISKDECSDIKAKDNMTKLLNDMIRVEAGPTPTESEIFFEFIIDGTDTSCHVWLNRDSEFLAKNLSGREYKLELSEENLKKLRHETGNSCKGFSPGSTRRLRLNIVALGFRASQVWNVDMVELEFKDGRRFKCSPGSTMQVKTGAEISIVCDKPFDCPICQPFQLGKHHNNCEVVRERGETCLFNYQCKNSYCCHHLRVCLDGDLDRLYFHELVSLNGQEVARIIVSPPENRRTCEPTTDFLTECLRDAAVPYNALGFSENLKYNLTQCNCKASFLHLVSRNQWVPCPEIPEEAMRCTDFSMRKDSDMERVDPLSAIIAGSVGGAVLLAIVVFAFYYHRRGVKRRLAEEQAYAQELAERLAHEEEKDELERSVGISAGNTTAIHSNVIAQICDHPLEVMAASSDQRRQSVNATGRRQSFVLVEPAEISGVASSTSGPLKPLTLKDGETGEGKSDEERKSDESDEEEEEEDWYGKKQETPRLPGGQLVTKSLVLVKTAAKFRSSLTRARRKSMSALGTL